MRSLDQLTKELHFFYGLRIDPVGDSAVRRGWQESLTADERELLDAHIRRVMQANNVTEEFMKALGGQLADGLASGLMRGHSMMMRRKLRQAARYVAIEGL